MEQDFYDVALAKFLQGTPELGNLIVTFKDVSDDLQEDAGIQVGVFVLRSGTEVFYVPVISKGENVYPMDSIFFASKQKFFPLTKKTVATVLNSSQMSQGKGRKMPDTVVANPDVSQLINPPRTGKFVSASTSRLSDFMASMPGYLKDFAFEKISQEKSVYENLHQLFSIRDIFAALKSPSASMAAVTNAVPVSIVTGSDSGLSDEEIAAVLEHGYAVRGTPAANRVAIAAETANDGKFTSVTELDGNSDFELMFDRGNSREAFIPNVMNIGQDSQGSTRQTVALFTNGDYAVGTEFVAKGERLNRTSVLDTMFNNNPPVLPRDVAIGDTFAVIDTSANLLGVFTARKVMLNHLGVEIDATVRAGFRMGTIRLNAFRDYGTAPTLVGREVYLPYSTLVIKLGGDVTFDLERSVNNASRKHEVANAGLLGDQINLGYDGVEFSANGHTLGTEKQAMSRLVVEEGIDPVLASSFIKQAKENKLTRIYLSKQAGAKFEAGQIAQFGAQPEKQGPLGLNGSFIPNVQKSLAISDAQATEATIISELLQAPDMIELVEEYLPDLEEAIDRLGRIMFLSRVNITQLSENNDADSIFAFLASLKAVYRLLGDNFIKLQELVALKPTQKK